MENRRAGSNPAIRQSDLRGIPAASSSGSHNFKGGNDSDSNKKKEKKTNITLESLDHIPSQAHHSIGAFNPHTFLPQQD